ncbi:hypothetical protein D3C78_649050 [compost metagenome]
MRLLFAQVFQGFHLTVQCLAGFIGVLPQFPLRAAEFLRIQPGLVERLALTLDRLAQPVVFALQISDAAFCLLQQSGLRRRRATGGGKLRGKFRRFFACGFKTVTGDGQLRAGLAEPLNFPRLGIQLFKAGAALLDGSCQLFRADLRGSEGTGELINRIKNHLQAQVVVTHRWPRFAEWLCVATPARPLAA